MTEWIDTNILVRYFVRDVEEQYVLVEKWFKEARDGKRDLAVSAMVVSEVCYVLESFYKRSRVEIADYLESTLSQSWLRVQERKVLLGSLRYFSRGEHIVDSYLISKARMRDGKVLSFDKKLVSEVG